ncbi:hypothetical protein B0H17DRAFT_182702 [Mycena rosella]|uniref:Uncharacterized protein n=1 Tax=Mycena rosella TaxID=1033263 RepID=A0AAD7D0J6_MYCRO|nr:hypothetical protein B0H17DRAFT_182702 [Mycena rosella]
MIYLSRFYPTGWPGDAWEASRGQSCLTIVQLLAEVDRYIETKDFVLQLRMATLTRMLYSGAEDQASVVSSCVSSPSQHSASKDSSAPASTILLGWSPPSLDPHKQINAPVPLALPSLSYSTDLADYAITVAQFAGFPWRGPADSGPETARTSSAAPNVLGSHSLGRYSSPKLSKIPEDADAYLDLFLSLSDPSGTPTSPDVNSDKILEILRTSADQAVSSYPKDGEIFRTPIPVHSDSFLGNYPSQSLPACHYTELPRAYPSEVPNTDSGLLGAIINSAETSAPTTSTPGADHAEGFPTTPVAHQGPIYTDTVNASGGVEESIPNFWSPTKIHTSLLATPTRRQFSGRVINIENPSPLARQSSNRTMAY